MENSFQSLSSNDFLSGEMMAATEEVMTTRVTSGLCLWAERRMPRVPSTAGRYKRRKGRVSIKDVPGEREREEDEQGGRKTNDEFFGVVRLEVEGRGSVGDALNTNDRLVESIFLWKSEPNRASDVSFARSGGQPERQKGLGRDVPCRCPRRWRTRKVGPWKASWDTLPTMSVIRLGLEATNARDQRKEVRSASEQFLRQEYTYLLSRPNGTLDLVSAIEEGLDDVDLLVGIRTGVMEEREAESARSATAHGFAESIYEEYKRDEHSRRWSRMLQWWGSMSSMERRKGHQEMFAAGLTTAATRQTLEPRAGALGDMMEMLS
jgi:hypothetical protein